MAVARRGHVMRGRAARFAELGLSKSSLGANIVINILILVILSSATDQ